MISTEGFLAGLRRQDIRVWVEDGRLRCSAPEGMLTGALQAELSRRKADILASFRVHAGVSAPPSPAIGPLDGDRSVPPSFGQRRLWFIERMAPGVAVYNITMPTCFEGKLATDALRSSLASIVERHEILRTTFALSDGEMAQVVGPPYSPLGAVEEAGSTPAERDAFVREVVRQERSREFNLDREPPLRARLVRRGEQDHVLILTVHHSAADGWSLGLIQRELAAFYRAAVDGGPSPLPALPIQYREFAGWQREVVSGDVLEAQLAYWKAQLEEMPTAMELPAYRTRPAMQTYNGAGAEFTCPKAVVDALRKIGQREHVTLFMILLAAWTILLRRYTGQDDVVVGSPIAGRTRRELEDLIGFFVNSLVLRVDLSGDPTFAQVLGRVKNVTLDAYANQDVPFEKLVEVLRPPRDLSRSPLFQVEFVLQDERTQSIEFPDLKVAPLPEPPVLAAKLDLSVELTPGPDGIRGICFYNTDVLDRGTVDRLGQHFVTLLESISRGVDQRVSALALLPDAERRLLIVDWNATQADYGTPQCLHEMFEAQVEKTPAAVAVVAEGASLTYRELNARANQLAHHLRARGVGPEMLVGICMERSIDMVVGLLGILKAGGAYVPLDPAYPADRLAFMFEDSRPAVVLTQDRLLGTLPPGMTNIFCLDRDAAMLTAEAVENPATVVPPDGLAYMIYTSGSTGRPKGAMNTHRGIWNRLRWGQQAYELTTNDRVLQKTPFSFDISVWEFFWPLSVGARLVMARPGGHQDRTYLADVIASEEITTVHFVPSMLQVFLEEPRLERCRSLKRVICSGEALSADLVSRWHARMDAPLHNLYGPTEAAVEVTYWACERGASRTSVPIGRPVSNTQIRVLDPGFEPVPVGVAGELYIGGGQVGRGYHRRPDLTAERFIPDPFSSEPGARLYRTGDLARYLPDGVIEYLGRIDHQVKIRGFRIELGELEAVLAEQPGTAQAVAMVREDVPGDRRLVAYVVAEGDRNQIVSGLRAIVARRLPQYMHPAAYVVLETMPLLPNGKVDRKALPLPEGRRVLEHVATAPRSDLEREIANVWREVLRVDDIGIYDNFFELGGHSLLAMQLTARLYRALGTELQLRSIFQAPTIAEMGDLVLSKWLEEQGAEAAEALLAEVQGLGQGDPALDPHG